MYIFIYKLHDQTRDRARDQTCEVMSLCAIEDQLPLLLLHRIAVFKKIPFVSRP